MTLNSTLRQRIFFWLQIIGAVFCLFEGVFVMIQNMSSIGENETLKSLYIVLGIIVVVFKNIFRMVGKKFIVAWCVGAVITGFFTLSFVLTGTETQTVHKTGAELAQDAKQPQYVIDAYNDARNAQKALSDLQAKQAAIPGNQRTNIAALDGPIQTAKETRDAANVIEKEARERWYKSLEDAQISTTKEDQTALSVFGRIPNFLTNADAPHWIAFIVWLMLVVFVEWIDFYSFGTNSAASTEIIENIKQRVSLSKLAKLYRKDAINDDGTIKSVKEMAQRRGIAESTAMRIHDEAFSNDTLVNVDGVFRLKDSVNV
jgi:hypothetical protein